jgi:hypothetical protein
VSDCPPSDRPPAIGGRITTVSPSFRTVLAHSLRSTLSPFKAIANPLLSIPSTPKILAKDDPYFSLMAFRKSIMVDPSSNVIVSDSLPVISLRNA